MSTGIEWTDETWNAVTGCREVSRGCDHCYAARLARGKLAEVYGRRLPVVDTPENRADPFAVRIWPERLDQPRRWRKPRTVFVNSMSDFWHVDVPAAFQRRMMEVMLAEDRHTYQILTKRPGRAIRFFRDHADLLRGRTLFDAGRLPPHIWVGTSVEDEDAAYRIGQLRKVPATIRFLSCEPLIGPLGLSDQLHGIHWVITGGESGPGHRPCDPEWVRSIRDACHEADVAFFHKQWGGYTPKAGGRELDGRTWDAYPDVHALDEDLDIVLDTEGGPVL